MNSKELVHFKNKNIIANANCSVIPLVVALKPLHDLYTVKRIVVSTYQSVSGAGKAPMDELLSQTQEYFDNNNKKQNGNNLEFRDPWSGGQFNPQIRKSELELEKKQMENCHFVSCANY